MLYFSHNFIKWSNSLFGIPDFRHWMYTMNIIQKHAVRSKFDIYVCINVSVYPQTPVGLK